MHGDANHPEATMLSRETLERYRRMTTAERLKLALKMSDEAAVYLLRGTPEQATAGSSY